MRKAFVDDADRFRRGTSVRLRRSKLLGYTTWRCAAAAGLMRDRQRDAFIVGGREQGRLSIARMAERGDTRLVDAAVRYQIINTALKSPGPARNATAVACQ